MVVAVAGALPSVLWALDGSDLLHDDWAITEGVQRLGVWHEVASRATGSPARPLSALYLGLTHGAFGSHPLPHVLVLAALNAAAAALVLLLACRLAGRDLALWIALAWVALPNRGSTRLWIAMGSAMLALCLLLAGIVLLWERRDLAAGLTMAAGVLAYEAVAALALGAVAVVAWRSRPASRRLWLSAAVPVIAATVVIFAMSPKRNPAANVPFSNWERLLPAQFGTGVFGPLAFPGGFVLLAAVTVAVARLLPSFRGSLDDRDRCVLAGLGVLALGSGPFLVAGFPFATGGLVDRGNLTGGLGTAMILGAVLWWVAAKVRVAGPAGAAAAVVLVAVLNGTDLGNYRRAVRDGEVLEARLAADLPSFDESLVVGPPLPDRGGVKQFIVYGDLAGALRLSRGEPALVARMALTRADFATATEPLRYDWVERRVSHR